MKSLAKKAVFEKTAFRTNHPKKGGKWEGNRIETGETPGRKREHAHRATGLYCSEKSSSGNKRTRWLKLKKKGKRRLCREPGGKVYERAPKERSGAQSET